MEKAPLVLMEQQRRTERQIATERERVAVREGRGRPANPTHTWIRRAPRQNNPPVQVEVMELDENTVEMEDLSLEDITLLQGKHDHLLQGQDHDLDRA